MIDKKPSVACGRFQSVSVYFSNVSLSGSLTFAALFPYPYLSLVSTLLDTISPFQAIPSMLCLYRFPPRAGSHCYYSFSLILENFNTSFFTILLFCFFFSLDFIVSKLFLFETSPSFSLDLSPSFHSLGLFFFFFSIVP